MGVSLVDGTGTLKCPSFVSRELSHALLTNTIVANEGLTSLDFKFQVRWGLSLSHDKQYGVRVHRLSRRPSDYNDC